MHGTVQMATLLAATFIALACTSGPVAPSVTTPPTTVGGPTGAVSPAVAASASLVATTASTTMPSGQAAASARPLVMGPLTAGRYQTKAFEPTLTFDLPDGWHEYFPEDSDEIALGGAGADLNITRPRQVANPTGGAALDAPESLIDWFKTRPDLQLGAAETVQIAGVEAAYIDIPALAKEIGLFHYPGGDMHTASGVPARLYIVPMDGADLVLVILPAPATTDLPAAVEAVQPIVDSLQIGP